MSIGRGEPHLDVLGSSAPANDLAPNGTHRCVFCREEIQPFASLCPHCRSNLVPLQRLADEGAALEERVAMLEHAVATLQLANSAVAERESPAVVASVDAVPPTILGIKWPHMADNIFLGLVTLIAAHWLAASVPADKRTVFGLVALVVALPFGYRFERNSRSDVSVQVIAALAYGSLGTMALGLLDMAVADLTPRSLSAPKIVASVAAIALSHFAGSALAHARQSRADRAASIAAAHPGDLLPHLEAAQIKTTAETVKALYEAAAPIAAGTAAVWAAFNHILF
jgi:hypothetical protein